MEFRCTFTAKDAALFALSLGYGSTWDSYKDDLHYVWEAHEEFDVVPMFAFALMFWSIKKHAAAAASGSPLSSSLPQFPPPIIQSMGVIPPQCLVGGEDAVAALDEYPVLHMWQKITWSQTMTSVLSRQNKQPNQRTVSNGHVGSCILNCRFLSVNPKSVGTFVTTESIVTNESTGSVVCTIQSTALIFGLDESLVTAWTESGNEESSPSAMSAASSAVALPAQLQNQPWFEQEIPLAVHQALLYRLASGDSNVIHVDASALPPLIATKESSDNASEDDESASKKPILHGLATLGMVARVLEQRITKRLGKKIEWTHLEARFRQPVFPGESLQVCAWWLNEEQHGGEVEVFFRVMRLESSSSGGNVAIDNGLAKVKPIHYARL